MRYYLAIDIGASSGRHIVGWKEAGHLRSREVYRFPNSVCREDGHLVWDITRLEQEIKAGIRACFAEFGQIHSLSIDTWGVDYVLLVDDRPILPVYAYRDSRTHEVIPRVHRHIPFSALYRYTGCQFQPFNTIYQLCADQLSGRLDRATDLMMIPEYLLYKLCGIKAREYTNTTTTGMVCARTGQFHGDILRTLGYPERLFPALQQPGIVLGELLPEVAREVGGSCKVVLCATHDTASAVEGIPMEEDAPYISSGTWSLLGVKTPKPLTDPESEGPTTPTKAAWAITATRRTGGAGRAFWRTIPQGFPGGYGAGIVWREAKDGLPGKLDSAGKTHGERVPGVSQNLDGK